MITIDGAESARAAAAKLAAHGEAVAATTDTLLEERASTLWETARAYEPPPLLTYRRTGHLQRSWLMQRKGKGWLVGSDVPYARFVRGDERGGQAWMHVGRWRLFMDMVGDVGVGLRAKLVERLRRVLRV